MDPEKVSKTGHGLGLIVLYDIERQGEGFGRIGRERKLTCCREFLEFSPKYNFRLNVLTLDSRLVEILQDEIIPSGVLDGRRRWRLDRLWRLLGLLWLLLLMEIRIIMRGVRKAVRR